ncbi:MAG TPA: T9SS type A sorting domain-containing protein [Flavobacterium sp.]|nr:T9SS type A sorting domain-containing protein [Flavobacterium sp.]
MKKALLFLFTMVSSATFAQTIFSDDFASYTSGQQLSGQGSWSNNSSQPGGLGNCTGAICQNAKVVDQAIGAVGYGSSTKSFSLTPDTDGCGTSFTPFTQNGSLYVGMVINIANAQSSPVDFFRISSGSNFTTTFRMLAQPSSGTTYTIGISKGSLGNPIVYTANSYNYGTDYLLVFKYTQASGANDDTLVLFANANFSAGEIGNTASATTFAGTDQSGNIDRITFRQNAGPAGMPTGRVGLVSVANSWDDLSFSLSAPDFRRNTLSVYPNPARNLLNITSDRTISDLSVVNLLGQQMPVRSLDRSFSQLDVTGLAKGTYLVKVTTAAGTEVCRFIKE